MDKNSLPEPAAGRNPLLDAMNGMFRLLEEAVAKAQRAQEAVNRMTARAARPLRVDMQVHTPAWVEWDRADDSARSSYAILRDGGRYSIHLEAVADAFKEELNITDEEWEGEGFKVVCEPDLDCETLVFRLAQEGG